MSINYGIDIGGTKIAVAAYDENGAKLYESRTETPRDYEPFIQSVAKLIHEAQAKTGEKGLIGVCCPGAINYRAGTLISANLPFLNEKQVVADLAREIGQVIKFENDTLCISLAEALDGAGKGYNTILGMNIGTGVGTGFVFNGRLLHGANGLAGELGHLALPFYEPEDGDAFRCACCKQMACSENHISGPALERLYTFMTKNTASAAQISEGARSGDSDALRVLDHYFDIVAKSMVLILYSFDPEIIVVSGSMNDLPGFYEQVPKRVAKYSLVPNPIVNIAKAKHGPLAALRGASLLWKQGD